MRCHGINRLDDGFLGVYGKSETLGACSALAALGTRHSALGFLISRIHLGPIV